MVARPCFFSLFLVDDVAVDGPLGGKVSQYDGYPERADEYTTPSHLSHHNGSFRYATSPWTSVTSFHLSSILNETLKDGEQLKAPISRGWYWRYLDRRAGRSADWKRQPREGPARAVLY